MVISQTPLRISFLGGNTDFPSYYEKYGGLVLTTSIDKYIYCIVKKRFDDLIRVKYSIQESVEKIDDLKHDLVREAMKLLDIRGGIEIAFLSDIPGQGSGLGSSSSVTVGVLLALHRHKGENVSSEQLAKEACKIEINILKNPIGVQDQYIAALGGLRTIGFPKGGEEITLLNGQRDYFDNSLLLFHTGIARNASNILSHMRLDKKILDRNKELATKGSFYIKMGRMDEFGKLLNEYWQLKKRLNKKTTTSQIDDMYDRAINAGAYGGKIAGAGGGGFLLVITPPEKRQAIRKELSEYQELPIRISKDGAKIIFDIDRYE